MFADNVPFQIISSFCFVQAIWVFTEELGRFTTFKFHMLQQTPFETVSFLTGWALEFP